MKTKQETKWAAYNHNKTLLGVFKTKLLAVKEAREYSFLTANPSHVEKITD